MCDTNVLVSILLFPGTKSAAIIDVLSRDQLILSRYIVEELRFITKRKAPQLLASLEELLADLNPETIEDDPKNVSSAIAGLRDPKDVPVLAGAIAAGVDLLVTGDKDFDGVVLSRPLILTPAQYVALRGFDEPDRLIARLCPS